MSSLGGSGGAGRKGAAGGIVAKVAGMVVRFMLPRTARRGVGFSVRFSERFLFPDGFRSPDAWQYLSARPEAPFCRRWLPRVICGGDLAVWRVVTWGAILAAAVELGPKGGLVFLCLAMVRTWARIGVTPDALAFLAALASAHASSVPEAVGWALVAGACRETAPAFAALWAWSPWPLVGLLAVPWWRGGQGVTRLHRPAWSLGPWGLLPALVPWDLRTACTVAVGYAQCLVGSDGARLYLWACVPFLEALALAPWSIVIVAGASIAVARYEV